MTADRDYWKSQANGRLNFKTVTITLNILEYGKRMNGTVAHGCGVIPKYVFTKLSWICGDNHPQVTNFFLSNLGIINFDIDLAYYTNTNIELRVDNRNITITGNPRNSGDDLFWYISTSNPCYIFY